MHTWENSEGDKDIENAIDKIIETSEKPRTLTNKRLNGAQKFDETHQGEYEARGKQSKNKIQRVHRHNAAYPKMYDELDRRRSNMQITIIEANKVRNFHPDCEACDKLVTLHDLKSQNVKPRCESRSKFGSRRSTVKRCGIHRARSSRGIRFQGRRLVNRACQCTSILSLIYVTKKRNGTSDDFLPELDPEVIENARKPKKEISGTFYSDLALNDEPMVTKH